MTRPEDGALGCETLVTRLGSSAAELAQLTMINCSIALLRRRRQFAFLGVAQPAWHERTGQPVRHISLVLSMFSVAVGELGSAVWVDCVRRSDQREYLCAQGTRSTNWSVAASAFSGH